MEKINQLKAGAILSYISMGLGYIISIVYTPIMLRLLGQSEYGLYNLVASIVAYLGVLNFGFGSAYMRYYSRYKIKSDKEKIATLNGMFLIIFTIIGVVAVVAGIILAMNIEIIFGAQLTVSELVKAKVLMMIMVVNLAISFPTIVFTSHITANEKFIFQKIVNMISVVINPFIVLPVLFLGYGSIGLVVASTILNIVIGIINVCYCIKKLQMRFSIRNMDFTLMKEMTVFSSFIFIYMIIDQINWNIDKFILGRFKGTEEVAIYSVGAQFNSYLISIAAVVSGVFIPRVNKIVSEELKSKKLTDLFIRIGKIQFVLVALVVMGFTIFGESFINIWAGETYSKSYAVAMILMIPMGLVLIQNIGIEIRKAQDLHQTPAKFMLCIAIINIIITIPMAKEYGAIGSAIGTSIAVVINQIFINFYYFLVCGLDIKLFLKQILIFSKGLIIPIIVGCLMISNKGKFNDITFLSMVIPYIIIYFISLYYFSFEKYEKDLFIGQPYNKISNIVNRYVKK